MPIIHRAAEAVKHAWIVRRRKAPADHPCVSETTLSLSEVAMRHSIHRVMTGCATLTVSIGLAACSQDSPSPLQPGGLTPHAARGGADTPVSTYVLDSDTAVAPAFQIRSDGLGVYRNSNTLISVIQASAGAWVLDSQNPRNGTRMLYLDFGQPVAGSGPNGGDPVGVPSGLYKVHAISKCNIYGNSMWTLAPGASMACPLHIAFTYGGTGYAVQMNPYPAGDPEGAPETQWATVTCLTPVGAASCADWRLTPSATYTEADGSLRYRNVARLIKYVTTKNTTTNVNQGDFYVSFEIVVTNP